MKEYKYKINGNEYNVAVEELEGNKANVTVNGKTKFVCVDGPEFDAHAVDFDEMLSRLRQYKEEEVASMSLGVEEFRSSGVQEFRSLDGISEQSATPLVTPFVGTAKDRVAIPRVKMNELDPKVRVQSLYDEVNQGLTFEQAVMEAHRCLNCKNPRCVGACPVSVKIPQFISEVAAGNFDAQLKLLLYHVYGPTPASANEIFKQVTQLCENGNPMALAYAGFLYEHALGVKKDYCKAVEYYCKAYDAFNPISAPKKRALSASKANAELEKKGIITIAGRVNRKYFAERLCYGAADSAAAERR